MADRPSRQVLEPGEAGDDPRARAGLSADRRASPTSGCGELAGQALERAPELAEWIEPACRRSSGWPAWRRRRWPNAHRDPAAAKARKRLAYDEMFANQLALMLLRAASRRRKRGVPLQGDGRLREQAASCPTA